MTGTPQAHRRLVRDYFAAWDGGDPDAIAAFFADDFGTTYTDWTGETVRVEPPGVREWIAGWLEVIGGMAHEVHDIVAEGDRAMARVTYRGTHEGALFGVEPTGNAVAVEEYVSFRIEEGAIVELDWLSDTLALLRQLDVALPFDAEA